MSVFRIDGNVIHLEKNDFPNVLNEDELYFYNNLAIPYLDGGDYWNKLDNIQSKLCEGFKSGKIKQAEYHGVDSVSYRPYVQSDYINTPGGAIQGQHNGKHYDSKHKYYSDLKATGHMVVEAGMTKEKRELRGDYDVSKELKAAYQEVKARH